MGVTLQGANLSDANFKGAIHQTLDKAEQQ